MVKRDADLKLQKISQHYEEKCQQLNSSVMIPPITIPPQQKRQFKVQDVRKMKIIEKVKYNTIILFSLYSFTMT